MDHRTPNVFLEFCWPLRVKYSSYLEISLAFSGKSDNIIPRSHYSRAPWEQEVGLYPYMDEIVVPKEVQKQHSISEDLRLRSWEKYVDLPSMLPNMRVWKFDPEEQGALRLCFSS